MVLKCIQDISFYCILFSVLTGASHRGLDSTDTLDTVLAKLVMSNVL